MSRRSGGIVHDSCRARGRYKANSAEPPSTISRRRSQESIGQRASDLRENLQPAALGFRPSRARWWAAGKITHATSRHAEIKSSLILQPSPAALTDDLVALQIIIEDPILSKTTSSYQEGGQGNWYSHPALDACLRGHDVRRFMHPNTRPGIPVQLAQVH